jgi:hypothetical protein
MKFEPTKIWFSLADVLEIENLLSAYLNHLRSYEEDNEDMEKMRLAQVVRVDDIVIKIEKIFRELSDD